jgi:flagellar biosynthesis/type III secretory pathway M-ring protein FliF/YscJ
MDALKAQFERIRQQLAALSATQKMLVAALVAVMVLTVLYWGRYAGNAEMVPVLDQTLTDDDIGPIDHQLELAGVPHSVSGGKVLVPSDRKNEILANLMFARVLPQDTHSAFEQMSKSINPFTSNTQMEMAYTEATATELSSLISLFPGVANARVMINAKNEHRIEGEVAPSATVVIATRGGHEHVGDLVRAAADGVAHAVSNLSASRISVIVDGKSMKVPDSENDPLQQDTTLVEMRDKREATLQQKIQDLFGDISGLHVTVNCDLENRTVTEDSTRYDKGGTVLQPLETTSETNETSTQVPASHEPGAASNIGLGSGTASIGDTGSGSGSGNTTNETNETQKNIVKVGETHTVTSTPAGKDSVQSATVRVPSSYFLARYKLQKNAPKDATEAPADFLAAELGKIRAGVQGVLALKTDTALSVETYEDLPSDVQPLDASLAQASALSAVGGHAKDIGVAVLAIVSLMMMATLVRKSTPAPLVLPAGAGQGSAGAVATASGIGSIGSGETLAGEVGGGSGALDGMELDEDSVRTQQMLDQVSTMVKENPDGAAALVKRWMSRS